MAEPDALTAALIQLSEHAARLSALDARQADAAAGLDALHTLVSGFSARLELVVPADLGDCEPMLYSPCTTPRFWQLDSEARDEAVARLRDWVEQIYRPGYGHLAAALAGCWDQHPFCLYTLDWLSELWSVLYLQPKRTAGTLAGQAEWQTRLLTAASDQMSRETTRCAHTADRRPSYTTATRP